MTDPTLVGPIRIRYEYRIIGVDIDAVRTELAKCVPNQVRKIRRLKILSTFGDMLPESGSIIPESGSIRPVEYGMHARFKANPKGVYFRTTTTQVYGTVNLVVEEYIRFRLEFLSPTISGRRLASGREITSAADFILNAEFTDTIVYRSRSEYYFTKFDRERKAYQKILELRKFIRSVPLDLRPLLEDSIYKKLLSRNPWKIYKALPVKERHTYKNAIKTAIYFMNVMHKLPPELIQIILEHACE